MDRERVVLECVESEWCWNGLRASGVAGQLLDYTNWNWM